MDEELWTLMAGDPALISAAGGRIYWGIAPQGAQLPYIVLTVISGFDEPHLTGTDGLWRYRVQVDCYAENRPAVVGLSRDVAALLNGYSTFAGAGITSCFMSSSREYTEGAATERVSRISSDFNITWRA